LPRPRIELSEHFGRMLQLVACDPGCARHTISGAALSLAVNASGTVRLSTIMLMTPEEVDAACKKTVGYRAPGQ